MSFTLTTDRLILQVEDSQKAAMVLSLYQKNKDLFERFEPTRPNNFYTLDFQATFMDIEYKDTIKGTTLRYYIYLKEAPDTIIGSVNFSNIKHGPFSSATIGYKMDCSYHHQGYAVEACKAAIDVLFCNYKIHRIEARVAPDNIPSIKVLERLGFTFEGIEYSSVEIRGEFKDHYRYGLISTIQ